MERTDWKRHSAPYEYHIDDFGRKTSLTSNGPFHHAMTVFSEELEPQSSIVLRERKRSSPPKFVTTVQDNNAELSTDQYTPGVLKVFGETIFPGVQYKSVLASCRSTAQELVKQSLERFGLNPVEYPKYVLCDVVGRWEEGSATTSQNSAAGQRSGKWQVIYIRVLSDRDKPLLNQKFWKPQEGLCRRYELHKRSAVMESTEDDDTSGLNNNARKILMAKLRPGAIPLFDPDVTGCYTNGFSLEYAGMMRSDPNLCKSDGGNSDIKAKEFDHSDEKNVEHYKQEDNYPPQKNPYFLTIRGCDVRRDKIFHVIRSKKFAMGCSNKNEDKVPQIQLFDTDIEECHCKFKVYKFKSSTKRTDVIETRCNFFLEMEPMSSAFLALNGQTVTSKTLVQSGDLLSIGHHYILMYKDCSKGYDIPLQLPWFCKPEHYAMGAKMGQKLDYPNSDSTLTQVVDAEESKSSEESLDTSVIEKMSFSYSREKEDELVKYICAIVKENTSDCYPLAPAYLLGMCVEHASKKFERRHLKNLFLRVLSAIRENVTDTTKALSANKFQCTLLKTQVADDRQDELLERLLIWSSNCVQLLLFLKHTFQLPEVDTPIKTSSEGRSIKKEDGARTALSQLIAGLEEIITFCFQQSIYTLTKAVYPLLDSVLDNNPFSNSSNSTDDPESLEPLLHLLSTLAEVTHCFMLHEDITRQMFTYVFFFMNTFVFNRLMVEESGSPYYCWSAGVRIRANLSQIEDWATQNGLEDEFGQMFERLLAASELLATSRNTLVKYNWTTMKEHFLPLTDGQIYRLLMGYQLGGKAVPTLWIPPTEERENAINEDVQLSLCSHPAFCIPDNCGLIDLIRSPEDPAFWNHLRKLRGMYGTAEDDSDSGFSISNTPRCQNTIPKTELEQSFFHNQTLIEQTGSQSVQTESPHGLLIQKQKSKIPIPAAHTDQKTISCVDNLQKCNGCVRAVRARPEVAKKSKVHAPKAVALNETRSVSTELMLDLKGNFASDGSMKESKDKDITRLSSRRTPDEEHLPEAMRSASETQGILSHVNQTQEYVQNGIEGRQENGIKKHPIPSEQSHRELHTSSPFVGGTSVATNPLAENSERVRRPIIRHRKNDSFERAIEKGNESDSSQKLSHPARTWLSSIQEKMSKKIKNQDQPTVFSASKTQVGHLNPKQSVLTDEVFIDDLPKTRKSGRKSVSFDEESINSTSGMSESDTNVGEEAGKRPTATDNSVFVEVDESILAARKRQCSSLNVVPVEMDILDSSMTDTDTGVEGIQVEDGDQKKMLPCPLFTVHLDKGDKGLGLGLIDGLYTPLRLAGIYIRKILPDSPAAVNGCLQVGDRILAVCGKSVIGADYQSTMKLIRSAGDSLTLLVAKGNPSIAMKVSAAQF